MRPIDKGLEAKDSGGKKIDFSTSDTEKFDEWKKANADKPYREELIKKLTTGGVKFPDRQTKSAIPTKKQLESAFTALKKPVPKGTIPVLIDLLVDAKFGKGAKKVKSDALLEAQKVTVDIDLWDPDGSKRTGYRDAKGPLIKAMGEYCSFCERRIPAKMDVEHMAPKDVEESLRYEWTNFLLACGNCNSAKGTKNKVRIKVKTQQWQEKDYVTYIFWPDRIATTASGIATLRSGPYNSDSFNVLQYREGGIVTVHPEVLGNKTRKTIECKQTYDRILATLSVVNLDFHPGHDRTETTNLYFRTKGEKLSKTGHGKFDGSALKLSGEDPVLMVKKSALDVTATKVARAANTINVNQDDEEAEALKDQRWSQRSEAWNLAEWYRAKFDRLLLGNEKKLAKRPVLNQQLLNSDGTQKDLIREDLEWQKDKGGHEQWKKETEEGIVSRGKDLDALGLRIEDDYKRAVLANDQEIKNEQQFRLQQQEKFRQEKEAFQQKVSDLSKEYETAQKEQEQLNTLSTDISEKNKQLSEYISKNPTASNDENYKLAVLQVSQLQWQHSSRNFGLQAKAQGLQNQKSQLELLQNTINSGNEQEVKRLDELQEKIRQQRVEIDQKKKEADLDLSKQRSDLENVKKQYPLERDDRDQKLQLRAQDWTNRKGVFDKARLELLKEDKSLRSAEDRQEISTKDFDKRVKEMAKVVLKQASATGFWSVWITVFQKRGPSKDFYRRPAIVAVIDQLLTFPGTRPKTDFDPPLYDPVADVKAVQDEKELRKKQDEAKAKKQQEQEESVQKAILTDKQQIDDLKKQLELLQDNNKKLFEDNLLLKFKLQPPMPMPMFNFIPIPVQQNQNLNQPLNRKRTLSPTSRAKKEPEPKEKRKDDTTL